jgi:hypothetical protein
MRPVQKFPSEGPLGSGEDYRTLAALVEKAQLERPGFSFADPQLYPALPRPRREASVRNPSTPKRNTCARLHALARRGHRIAHETRADGPNE